MICSPAASLSGSAPTWKICGMGSRARTSPPGPASKEAVRAKLRASKEKGRHLSLPDLGPGNESHSTLNAGSVRLEPVSAAIARRRPAPLLRHHGLACASNWAHRDVGVQPCIHLAVTVPLALVAGMVRSHAQAPGTGPPGLGLYMWMCPTVCAAAQHRYSVLTFPHWPPRR